MNSTPASLLQRLQRPTADQEAWERFVRLYTPLLRHWARRLEIQGQDAIDLVQEVFTVLVQKLPEFHYDPRRRFRGWLWTVTANKARQRQRRPARLVQVGDKALDNLSAREEIDAVGEAEYQEYLVGRALELMRSEFEPTTWQAFWECVTAQRPASEVAKELNMSVPAVYAAKSRVLRRLRRDLEGLLN